MTNARDIIVKPIVTEKTVKLNEDGNTAVFEVAKDANKIAIKQAVEEIFDVKVESVHTVNTKSKEKRTGRYVGKTKAIKKAYVQLKEGSKITILEDK